MALECCSLRNPNPNPLGFTAPLPKLRFSTSSLSLRPNHRLFTLSSSSAFLPLTHRRSPILPFASSRDDSTPLDVEYEKERSGQEQKGKESEEAWEQALAAFKEQALKLQSVSQEAYEIYSKKAMVALKETAEQLQIESDKARYDITVMAQELGEEGKQYIVEAAANSPEPVKDVVETFVSATDDVKDVSEIRDFYIGIPYGAILSLGGFLDFMVTGRTSAIRFGVILGGALLALSLSSLKSFRKGESTDGVILTSETAIAGILFLRQLRLLFQSVSFLGLVSTSISGAIAAFFVYRFLSDRDAKGSDIDGEPQI